MANRNTHHARGGSQHQAGRTQQRAQGSYDGGRGYSEESGNFAGRNYEDRDDGRFDPQGDRGQMGGGYRSGYGQQSGSGYGVRRDQPSGYGGQPGYGGRPRWSGQQRQQGMSGQGYGGQPGYEPGSYGPQGYGGGNYGQYGEGGDYEGQYGRGGIQESGYGYDPAGAAGMGSESEWPTHEWRGENYGAGRGSYEQGAGRSGEGWGGYGRSSGGYGNRGTHGSGSYGAGGYGWTGDYGNHAASGARRGPKGWQRSDERIRDDISEQLYNSPHIDSSDVTIEVKDGRVTLEGTVGERHMKHAIEDLADNCPGVKDVDNRIRVERNGGSESASSMGSASGSTAGGAGQRSRKE